MMKNEKKYTFGENQDRCLSYFRKYFKTVNVESFHDCKCGCRPVYLKGLSNFFTLGEINCFCYFI